MNSAHAHMLLNHVPTAGFGIALALFIVALIWRNEFLTRVGLVMFFAVALLAIPAYISGNAAEQMLQDRSDISQIMIRAHEDAVLPAYAIMELAGFLAWIGLWQFRITSRLARWNLVSVLLLSVVSFGLMARAADMGGEIRHPEIQDAQVTVTTEAGSAEKVPVGATESIANFVTDHTWMRPACEIVHFLGLSMLFTVVLLVDLRLLGMAKSWPFSALYQLLPFGILGFGLNLVTGMIFFIATPEEFMKNGIFFTKIVFVVLAGANSLYFVLFEEPWTVGKGDEATLTLKAVAASAIVLWAGVLFFGHMLPFLGHAF